MRQAEVRFISPDGWQQENGLEVEVADTETASDACVLAMQRGGSYGSRVGAPIGAIVVFSVLASGRRWTKRERLSRDPDDSPHDSASWVPV